MAQPAGQTAQLVQSTSLYRAFEPYEDAAGLGIIIAAVGTLINPVAGAAIAVYYVTDIGSSVIADHFKVGETNPIARIARAAFISLASIAAAFATVCVLTGSVMILTPTMLAVGIFLVCFSVLGTVYLNEPPRSVAST